MDQSNLFWVFVGRGLLGVGAVAILSATFMLIKGRTTQADFQAWAIMWGGAAFFVFMFLVFAFAA